MPVDVRRARDRFVTRAPGRETWHAFSFGPHYDAANTGHGALVLHDEHLLAPGAGFPPHRHRGVEVVTWVLDGVLRHEGAGGAVRVLGPGDVQVLAAGTGVEHSERNDGDRPLRFVQAWLAGDDGPPRYDSAPAGVLDDALAPVAGPHGAVRLRSPAALHVGRLRAGAAVALPDAARLHVFVGRGAVELAGVRLERGGAARLTAEGGHVAVTAVEAAELLVWELPG